MKLAELLAGKGGGVVTIERAVSVADAVRTMNDNRVGSVVIAGPEGVPAGILTERDVMRLCAEGKGPELERLAVDEYMTRNVVVGKLEDTIEYTLDKMTSNRFRRMPVVDAGKLVGLITIGDLVKAKLAEMEAEAEALREYIHS